MKEKLCLPLDVSDFDQAKRLIDELADVVGVFKVGKQLFTKVGPPVVEYIHKQGGRVFLDLKFHDIPNTVKGASQSCVDLGVFMFNVHAGGGLAMMQAAAEAVVKADPKPVVLGVTVLTSLSESVLQEELGVRRSLKDHVRSLAELTKKSGLSGVVASPHEIALIREACGADFVILTPGVRPSWAAKGDQERVMTPGEAVKAGADFIVVGRPITQSKDPREAAIRVVEEMMG